MWGIFEEQAEGSEALFKFRGKNPGHCCAL